MASTLPPPPPASADAIGAALQVLGPLGSGDAPLGALTTYRIGGAAAVLASIETPEQLAAVAEAAAVSELPTLLVGKGSNLLVRDGGFPGIAIVLGAAFADIEIGSDLATGPGLDGPRRAPRGPGAVRAGGAASLPVVARKSAAAGLTGFEWAVGVPGSIGGAVRMNAGGHGSDMAATLTAIRRFDLASGEDEVVPAASLDLGYRSSSITGNQVVVWADLALVPGNREASEAEISEIVKWRRANQPGGQNAGSVFANPPGDSAGRLIDAAGCKGQRIGGAEVSVKHANFIQADADARAADVEELMVLVVRRVHDHSGVRLHTENLIVGRPDPASGSTP